MKDTLSTPAKLIIADSEHHADMLYVSGIFVPDAFIAIQIKDQWHALLSPLEVDRAKQHSKFDHTHLDTPWRQLASKQQRQGLAATAAAFLSNQQITNLEVPANFPLHYADQLRSWGFTVTANSGSLFPERTIKSEKEIQQLATAEQLTRQSMIAAEEFLASCHIGADLILREANSQNKVKAADVRRVIEVFLIANGAMPAHTIVACGKEGADPHNIGEGYIYAHQPIIIDIFPRLLSSGYWGDMTRTYVKGRASSDVKRIYQTVREGQQIGLSMVADGVDGMAIHHAIQQFFDAQGFPTKIIDGKQSGFFHGTGHGVGLEIHESPRISTTPYTLQCGEVVTVEPGLYYPGLGGVRLEDMVAVRQQGCDNLTNHPCTLEIA